MSIRACTAKRRTRRSSRRSRDATSTRSRSSRPRSSRAANLRDLPRHADTERRARRHVDSGHPVDGQRSRCIIRCPNRAIAIAHEVWVAKGSRLATLMAEKLEGETCQVNSRHHQAVKNVAPGWDVTGTAPDGVIEAIEQPARSCASPCSGIRKISGARASSGRCSRGSSKPRARQQDEPERRGFLSLYPASASLRAAGPARPDRCRSRRSRAALPTAR